MTDAELSATAAIGLGGNLASAEGCAKATVIAALSRLVRENVKLRGVSRLYRTPAFPAGSGPDFANAVALIATDLPPAELLDHLHAIEAQFGRRRDRRWGPRTLDIDLLYYDDRVLPDAAMQRRWRDLDLASQQTQAPETLILPHPRLQDRAFVLIPLAEIAPAWRHPLTGQSVADMVAALPAAEKAEVLPA